MSHLLRDLLNESALIDKLVQWGRLHTDIRESEIGYALDLCERVAGSLDVGACPNCGQIADWLIVTNHKHTLCTDCWRNAFMTGTAEESQRGELLLLNGQDLLDLSLCVHDASTLSVELKYAGGRHREQDTRIGFYRSDDSIYPLPSDLKAAMWKAYTNGDFDALEKMMNAFLCDSIVVDMFVRSCDEENLPALRVLLAAPSSLAKDKEFLAFYELRAWREDRRDLAALLMEAGKALS